MVWFRPFCCVSLAFAAGALAAGDYDALLGAMKKSWPNSEHFVGGGTWLTGWVGAAVPSVEMRC